MTINNRDRDPSPAGSLRRRAVLRTAGLAGAAAAGAAAMHRADPAGAAEPAAAAGPPVPADGAKPVPFHGVHQAGILDPQPPFAGFAAFDVRARNREELVEAFRILTVRSRTVIAGLKSADPEVAAVQKPPQDGLTITVGVGASLFDGRFGLAGSRPAGLTRMPAFRGDALNPSACHGDVSVQVCAAHPDAVLHVIRDLARETDGLLALRWRTDGFLNPPRPAGAPRSFVGFKDGIANPDPASDRDMKRLLWLGTAQNVPAWAREGCYQVLRTIRLRAEAWDKVPTERQEQIFGRHKASGAPLGGKEERDEPDFLADPEGRTVPLDSHIRLANPRTAQSVDSQLLRRSYNYDGGLDRDGTLDLGLVFACYQQDIARQFAAVQGRLEDEPFADFITTWGGGYFLVLPGVRDKKDWFGSALLGS